jgi:tetratricopeptide (TPR) repeat protein
MNSEQAELKTLKDEYLMATRRLSRVKSKAKRRELKEYVDDLKTKLGWTLLDYGKYEQGLALFESLSWRGYGEVKFNGICRALIEMRHYGEARRILEKGLEEFPESCALWTCLGNLNEILGDHFESLICFETAIRCDSEKSSGTLYNKALALVGLGSHADALSIIDHLIEEYPEEPMYLAERGNCALETGYPREALQYYQKAMALFSESPDTHTGVCIYAGMCSAYIELGMKREAMVITVEGLRRFPDEDSVLYYNAGAAFLGMGSRKEALEILNKGVEKFPSDEELKKFLKEVEDDMDDPDKGDNPPILGLLLLMAILQKRLRKK